jgi:CheY-like chemotaxis protein
MKELTPGDTLEIIAACFELLAQREEDIRSLYDRLQKYEPVPGTDGRVIGGITPTVEQIGRQSSPHWPGAIAVCGTPIVGRSLMLLCPQMGLRILGITDSGLEGLSLVEQHRPQFAFVDLDVNDIDGLVLISRMNEINPEMTVLALAAGTQESTLVSAIIAGAKEVIVKPLQAGRVIDSVNRLLKRSRSVNPKRIPVQVAPGKVEAIPFRDWSVL